jgi:hypothetical protein
MVQDKTIFLQRTIKTRIMENETRIQLEAILKERQLRITNILSVNNTREEKKAIKDTETWCKIELKKIDKEYSRSCYPE